MFKLQMKGLNHMSLLSKTIFSVHCRICEYLVCGSGSKYSVLITNIIGNLISPKRGVV